MSYRYDTGIFQKMLSILKNTHDLSILERLSISSANTTAGQMTRH